MISEAVHQLDVFYCHVGSPEIYTAMRLSNSNNICICNNLPTNWPINMNLINKSVLHMGAELMGLQLISGNLVQ